MELSESVQEEGRSEKKIVEEEREEQQSRLGLVASTPMTSSMPSLASPSYYVIYSLRSELLVAEMDVSRCSLVLDTSISATSNLERREYFHGFTGV